MPSVPDFLSTASNDAFVFAAGGDGGGGGMNGWIGRMLAIAVAVAVVAVVARAIWRSPASIKPANASTKAGTSRSKRCCCHGCFAGGRGMGGGAAVP